ncbi:hypothetical protein SKAU_G00096930 [Synaphobranchus kaupii]|uniref:Uncharacterized protein n=1 Tax=Synaphobranchus kaupii TaxID=118154 RepID=A0A9Q1FXT1_SYNKA|nr:hypothetical protein SKAU_G00096930 [Synaphobranchus kaupii]
MTSGSNGRSCTTEGRHTGKDVPVTQAVPLNPSLGLKSVGLPLETLLSVQLMVLFQPWFLFLFNVVIIQMWGVGQNGVSPMVVFLQYLSGASDWCLH